MRSLKNKHSVFYSYVVTNILWYVFAGLFSLFLILIVIDLFFPEVTNGFDFAVPIDPEKLSLNNTIDGTTIEIGEAYAIFKSTYIKELNFGLYIGLMSSLTIGVGMFLFGFYQLRMIIKSALNDFVFSAQNIKRLKIIAWILIAIDPFGWLAYRLFMVPIDDIVAINQLSLSLDFELGSFIYGLLLFALAAVFEKGYDMYQELKLTV